MMKKILNKTSFALVAILFVSLAFGQAKKPTLMVIPSDNWCIKNGYFTEVKGQGETIKVPNYKKAVQESSELLQVIAKINDMMADREFPLKNLESALKTLEAESAENAMMTSKTGASVAESPMDKLKKVAKADIIIQLTWTINAVGPKKSITYNLQGLDAYTDKQIAGAGDTGQPSFSVEVPVLLSEAVAANMDNFCSRLQAHFEDMFANGREIIVRIKKFDSWTGDLETEYDGKELKDVIRDWMTDNTVKGRNSPDDSENSMLFEQVRIPLYDTAGKAMDARAFLKGLQTFLKSPPYNITSKLTTKGLGQATLVLGEK